MKDKQNARIDLTEVFDLKYIADIQASFRKRLGHTVVFMDRDAHVLVDETGAVPVREGQRPHPCQHCQLLLEASGAELCHKSDKEAAEIAAILRKPLLYKCWTLKSNVAIPITVGDMDVIGNLYAGQFIAVVDNEEDRIRVQEECVARGLVVHSGKRPDGTPTEWIKAGFFWTREEVEQHASKQDAFAQQAQIQSGAVRAFRESWTKVKRITYLEAIDSVFLLKSVANTFATEAYERLAYQLNHDIRAASENLSKRAKKRRADAKDWIKQADNLIDTLAGKECSVADATEQMAALSIKVLSSSASDRIQVLSQNLNAKRDLAEWSGGAYEVDRIATELQELRDKVETYRSGDVRTSEPLDLSQRIGKLGEIMKTLGMIEERLQGLRIAVGVFVVGAFVLALCGIGLAIGIRNGLLGSLIGALSPIALAAIVIFPIRRWWRSKQSRKNRV